MKKLYTLLLITLPLLVSAQGIKFFEGTFEEAKAQAAKQEKLIFVDCYTTWCGPCKMMSRDIFPNEEVGKFYNKNYIAMKLDMEKEAGMKFGQKYAVSAYPTIYFLDETGEIIQKVVGAKRIEEFIAIGKSIMKKNDRSEIFAQQFEDGNRDFDFVLRYAKELNKVGKSSIGMANKYLKEQPSISNEQKALLLLEAANEADSKLFDQLINLKSEAIKATSKDYFEEKIIAACEKTIDKAIEYEYDDLLQEGVEKMKSAIPSKAAAFEQKSLMKYAVAFKTYEEWSKHAKKYFKKSGKNYETYTTLISDVQGFYRKNEDAKKDMFKWYDGLLKCEECGDKEFLSYAQLLFENGEKAKALEIANTLLNKNESAGKDTAMVKRFIQYLESHS